jgi:hypothetical protein
MNTKAPLPENSAPYTQLLYVDPATSRRVRSRLNPDLGCIRFELAAPIRAFPAHKRKRSHSGRYWFSRSETHIKYESRFEKTALTYMDFRGNASAGSSNPFYFLWPKGSKPVRHVPDFFMRQRDGSVLIVDVKPASRMTPKDRAQHSRARDACVELGWKYEEFTTIGRDAELNLRLLSGYGHRRFKPSEDLESAIDGVAGKGSIPLADLVAQTCRSNESVEVEVLCAVYHLIWTGKLRINLEQPFNLATRILR